MPTAAEAGGSRSFSRKIEITANIATIVVAVLLSVVLVQDYLSPGFLSRKAPARATNFVK